VPDHLAMKPDVPASVVEVFRICWPTIPDGRAQSGNFDATGPRDQSDVLAGGRQDRPSGATIAALKSRYRIAVHERSRTDNDAARPGAGSAGIAGSPTGTVCHLDAALLHRALHELPLAASTCCHRDVGNLVVRPASISSAPQRDALASRGGRQAAKYPVFQASDLVVLSKIDLLGVIDDFQPARAAAALRALGGTRR